MEKSVLVTREQLYEQVWSTPLTSLAKKYGISDVALGKICSRLNVPKPGLGYWAKIEAGQQPGRTPLPHRSLQQAYEIRPRPVERPETEQKARKEAHQYPHDWEWVGSGKFTLAVEGSEWGARGEWTDRTVKLEAMLPKMLAAMVEFVPLAKKVREERLEKETLQAEKDRRRWAEESRRQDEQRRLDNLVKAEKEVERSEAALRFLDRIEAEFRASGGDLPSAVAEWLVGARDIARRSNPIAEWVSELRDLAKQNGVESSSTTWPGDSE